jgi:hypothetical protein
MNHFVRNEDGKEASMTTDKMGFLAMAAIFGCIGGWLATCLTSPQPVTARVGERIPVDDDELEDRQADCQPRASLNLWNGDPPH